MTKMTIKPISSPVAEKSFIDSQPARDHTAMILPVSTIKTTKNIRSELGQLDDLIASIRTWGILQPLLIAKSAQGLELIAGYRRLEAAKALNMKEVPVRFLKVHDDSINVVRLIENIVRQDLNGADEILAVSALASGFRDQAQLADAIGKSRTYVSRCLKAATYLKGLNCDVATLRLSKSAIFEIAESMNHENFEKQLADNPEARSSVRELRKSNERKPSGPIAGGRFGAEGALKFKENAKTNSFSLNINFDPSRCPNGTKEQIVKTLKEILKRLADS